MSKFFELIRILLEDLLTQHIDPRKIQQILDNQAAAAADLLAIKAYFGIPDPRIGATQDQLDTLGARVASETEAINQFDAGIHPPDPPTQP